MHPADTDPVLAVRVLVAARGCASGMRLLSVDSGKCRLVLFPVAGDRAEG